MTANRTEVGGILFTLTHHDRSWQAHFLHLRHRPFQQR